MAPRDRGATPPEVRNTFYLTVIVIAAVLAGCLGIGYAINLRRSGVSYMMPVSGKAVSRSVARVVESRLSEARLRMLMAGAVPAASAKTAAAEADATKPGAKKASAPLSAEQQKLRHIQKDPKARQKDPAEGQAKDAEGSVDTTPETYLINRLTDERVFGIDSFQALHLAIQGAGVVLESAKQKLEWLGQTEDLGVPKFLPWLPKPQQERLEAVIERELTKWVRRAERAHKTKRSGRSKRST